MTTSVNVSPEVRAAINKIRAEQIAQKENQMFSPHGCVLGPGHPDAARLAAMAKNSVPMNRAAQKNFTPHSAAHAQAALDAMNDGFFMGKPDPKFVKRMEDFIANAPAPAPARTPTDLRALMQELMDGD